jgi:DNA polymerase-3 subunit gamma/tau
MILLRMLTFRPAPIVIEYLPSIPVPTELRPSGSGNPLASPRGSNLSGETVTEAEYSSMIIPIAHEKQMKAELVVAEIKPPTTIPIEEKPQIYVETNWATIIQQLNLNGLALSALQNAELVSKSSFECAIRVAPGHSSLFTPSICTRIEAALSAYYQEKIKLLIRREDLLESSPAQLHQQIVLQDAKNAEQNLKNDPVFQQLQQEFSAELLKNSIISLKDDI